MKKLIYFFFAVFLAHAQQEKTPKTIESIFNESSMVFSGQVIDKQSYWDINYNRIYTVHKIETFNFFKGESTNFLYFITEGGTIGLEGMISSNKIRINRNSKGYFQLLESSNIQLDGFDLDTKLYTLTDKYFGFLEYDNFTNQVNLRNNDFKSVSDFENIFLSISKKNPTRNTNPFAYANSSANLNSNSISITNFYPESIPAGNRSTLTIYGEGFGKYETSSGRGSIFFKAADDGGSSWIECLTSQIISWSDEIIKVQVPSDSGTGPVRIQTSKGVNFESPQTLNIPYNIQGLVYPNDGSDDAIEYPIYHTGSVVDDLSAEMDSPGSQEPQSHISGGKFNLTFNKQFFENTPVKDSFLLQLEDWTCNTGINISVNEGTSVKATYSRDAVNLVTFSSTQSLGTTYWYFNGCIFVDPITDEITDVSIFFDEIDIVFNSDINWGFDNVAPDEFDFSSTALHELGHAVGLGHVIDRFGLMHYAGGSGEDNNAVIDDYLEAVNLILRRNISSALCGVLNPHEVSECSAIDINEDSDSDGINDIFDDCANTPINEEVDENGCGNSQKDSDNDGLYDNEDSCPNTPPFAVTNSEGCADTDNDGVFDSFDICPKTPAGAETDDDGCAIFERDSDGDGVTDDFDQCPNTTDGVNVDAYGCYVFLLDYDNFEVVGSSSSCNEAANGFITVSVKNQDLNYQVSVNNKKYQLNDVNGYDLIIDSLDVGNYSVCFSVIGNDDFEQCFNVVLREPEKLSVFDSLSSNGEFVIFELSGSDSFVLTHNDVTKIYKTNSIIVPLHKGINTFSISTGLECQGEFHKSFFNSEEIFIYPNPVDDHINILVNGNDEQVRLVIRNMTGSIYLSEIKNINQQRLISLSVDDFSTGIYFIEISGHTVKQFSKILKNE